MAYFNHAFQKAFLATGETQVATVITLPDGSTTTATTSDGYLITSGLPTYTLNQLSANGTSATTDGYIGWFNPKTNLSVDINDEGFAPCCNLFLAGSAIYSNDKIGPLAGGYQETNKSKMVNPKYVSRFYEVEPCTPQNNVIHVGSTYWTAGGGVLIGSITTPGVGYLPAPQATAVATTTTTTLGTGTGLVLSITISALGVPTVTGIVNPGKGYAAGDTVTIDCIQALCVPGTLAIYTVSLLPGSVTDAHAQIGCGTTADCCKEYLCGETYSLRLDIKGSPALRFLNHNAYNTVDAYTGCCPADSISPIAVDSTTVMILWANGLTTNPIVGPFVQIVVQAEDGTLWYAPGTNAAFLAANGADTWNNYVSTGHVDGACAGLILNGAYVDTKFGDCTFQLSDFYEKEAVKLYASEVDYNGEPCTFTTLCVVTECQGLQVQGLGETVVRDLAMSESYRQNFLATDLRIREITQGNQIISSVDRNALYYRYMLQHNVPRFNNPSSTFDNDQYMLEIFSLAPLTTFLEDTAGWLDSCGVCEIEFFGCDTVCDVPIAFPAVPPYNPYNVVSCY
jgi:hypothetical protein